MNDTIVQISNGSVERTISFAATATHNSFSGIALRDPEALWTPNCFVGPGAIIRLLIDLDKVLPASAAGGGKVYPQDTLVIKIVPKHGHVTTIDLTMPDAFMGKYIDLY